MKTELLSKLVAPLGVSGCEKRISDTIRAIMEPLCDECYNDAMGNLIAVKHGTGGATAHHKKTMLCAHMDEIGFLVTFIEENGLVRFATVGGINFTAFSYVQVVSDKGVKGVMVPDSDAKAGELTFDKCSIDIGASSRREAERRVSIGDVFGVLPGVTRLGGHRVVGHPLDDRAGCAVLVMVAEQLGECEDDVYFVFSVQEEVGCRGARPAAFAVAPDRALVYDVTRTGDTPGSKPMAVKLGGGAAIKIKDSSVICHAGMVDELIGVAKQNKIKYQCEVLVSGGTDTSSIQMSGAGCPAAAISLPSRYIHSGVEMIDLDDVEATVALTLAYLRR